MSLSFTIPGLITVLTSTGILVDNLWLVSDRWGYFVAPVACTMKVPDQVFTQTVLTVSCSVMVLGPSLFEGHYVASDAQVTLSLPQGYMYTVVLSS